MSDTLSPPTDHEAALVLSAQWLTSLTERLTGVAISWNLEQLERSDFAQDLRYLEMAGQQAIPAKDRAKLLARIDRVTKHVFRSPINEGIMIPRRAAAISPWLRITNMALGQTYTAKELAGVTAAEARIPQETRRSLSLLRQSGAMHTFFSGGNHAYLHDEIEARRREKLRDPSPGRGRARQPNPSPRALRARMTRSRGA